MSPSENPSPMRKRREEKGLTQTAVAKKVGTSQQTYQKYETGELEPLISTATRLCDALEAEFEQLFPPSVIKKYPRRKVAKKKAKTKRKARKK